MDELKKVFDKSQRNTAAMNAFGARLKSQFSTNESFRRAKELQWLEDLRAYKGLYDPGVLRDTNASKVYPKLTRSKCNMVLSRLHEMLFPETDKNWEIMPTPDPKIAPETFKKIVFSLMQKAALEIQQQSQASPSMEQQPPPPPKLEDVRLAIKKYCEDSCEAMSRVIDDQLLEMDYPEETKKVLRSALIFGTGIMKGPMINYRTKHIWEPNGKGEYEEAKQKEEIPYYEAIRIWDWYPDMTITDHEQSEGDFERHLMNKHDIRKLMNREDYYKDMIEEYLEAHPSGDYVAKNWEVDLQTIEVMAGAGRDAQFTGSSSSSDTVSNNMGGNTRTSNRQLGKKYEVLEYWGYVDGSDLQACGVQIDDVTLEYAANVWILGDKPIKAVLFDGALDKYKLFYYEKDETSMFGEGLARVMRHSQIAIAAGARMVLDNAACVAGPMLEVNWNLCTPDTDIDSFYPRKIFYREGRGIEAQYPAVRAINFDSHVKELTGIVDLFKQFADEETCLPTWMIGQMVNNETAQATSGRQAQITISIKDVVKNFDTFTEKAIRDLYHWNMEFNTREDIKGDYDVKARGVSSLVMKEIRMQAITQLMPTMAPEDWVYLDRREFLKERLKAYDLNINIKTEEEADKVREAQQNSEMNRLQIESMKAEIGYRKAQSMKQLAGAKKHNVEATKDAATPPEQPQGENPELQNAELAQKGVEIEGAKRKNDLDATKQVEDMQMGREKHNLELQHEHEKHLLDLGIKAETAKRGMKMKEKAAKQPKEKKPKKSEGAK